jgi:peptidoglycan/LPS O-acetylase OafA/YrhL
MGFLAFQTYDRYHVHISRWNEKIAIGLLAILVIFMSFKENPKIDGLLVLPIFFALIIAIAAEPAGMVSKAVNSPLLRWLGRVSYSIYMTHYMVLMLLSRWVTRAESHFSPHDQKAIGLAFVLVAISSVLFISQVLSLD